MESQTERAVRRIVPWVVSVALHAGLIVLGFLATWTVMYLAGEEEPLRVEAEFYNLDYDPLVRVQTGASTLEEPLPPSRLPVETTLERASEGRSELVMPLSVASETAAPSLAGLSSAPLGDSATFLGLRASNARRIAYVIDASGSMIRALPVVIEELARSLEALSPAQSFGILFFQRDEALSVPPAGRLAPATDQARLDALRWVQQNVRPGGRTNPGPALERALGLEPDVVFLLSENITGSGPWEIDQQDLLERLEALNPPRDAGRRACRIACVQFLAPDPLETLRAIAQRHGGAEGYRFLDAAELGLAAP